MEYAVMFNILSFPHAYSGARFSAATCLLFYKTVLHHSFCSSFIIQMQLSVDFIVKFMTCIHFPPPLIRNLIKGPVC
jgi:hypothetical protein